MKAKKKSLLLVIALSLLMSCSGLSNDEGGEGGVVTVKMSLMNSTNENPGWLAMIEAANEVLEEEGANVAIEPEIIMTSSWDEYYTKVTSNMLGRVGGTIGRIAESHIPLMIERNQLQDVTSIVEELKAKDGYNAASFEGVAAKDGHYYGLPTGTQHMLLYYNKTIFDRYNEEHPDDRLDYPSSDWNSPSTFAEIEEMAAKLSSGEGAARRFGLSAGPYLAYAGMYAVNSGGENIFNDEGECIIASEPYYEVYEWFDRMLKEDRSMPNSSDTATASAFDRFLSGNIAMMIDGVWQLHDIANYTEDFEMGVAAIPNKGEGYPCVSTTFTDRFFAARTSSHPEADQKALKALMSVEAISAVAEEHVGGFPIEESAVEAYLSSLEESKLSSYVDTIKEGMNRGVNVPYSTYYNLVDQRINQRMSAWINGDIDGRQFVDEMDGYMKDGMAGLL